MKRYKEMGERRWRMGRDEGGEKDESNDGRGEAEDNGVGARGDRLLKQERYMIENLMRLMRREKKLKQHNFQILSSMYRLSNVEIFWYLPSKIYSSALLDLYIKVD